MRKTYGKTIWGTLREYGVWQPGIPIRLGDYGTLSEGCFSPHGNIYDETTQPTLSPRTAHLHNLFVATEHGVAVEPSATAADQASVEFVFSKQAGVIVAAENVVSETVADLIELNNAISSVENWQYSHRVVTSVRRCGNYAVFGTQGGGGTVRLSAQEKLLSDFLGGACSLSGKLKVAGATGLSLSGSDGPISVHLHRRALWGNNLKQLSPSQTDNDREILVPVIDPVTDESS